MRFVPGYSFRKRKTNPLYHAKKNKARPIWDRGALCPWLHAFGSGSKNQPIKDARLLCAQGGEAKSSTAEQASGIGTSPTCIAGAGGEVKVNEKGGEYAVGE